MKTENSEDEIENVNNQNEDNEMKETLESIAEKENQYRAQIEHLESELEVEKKINVSIQRKPEDEEKISKLKKKYNETEVKYKKLKLTNERQKEAIEQLQNQLSNTYKLNRNINNPLKEKKENKENKSNTKSKLEELEDLRKENETMKEQLERTGDYNKKVELKDNSNEKKIIIKNLQDEIKILDNDLKEHEICIQEQKDFENSKEELKKEIKESKDNNKNLNKQYKKKLKKLQALMLGEEINEEEEEEEELDFYSRIKKKKKKDEEKDNNNIIIEKKPLKKMNLKEVESKIKNSMKNSIVTEEFKKNLEEIIGSDAELLIKKIIDVENRRKKLEIKNKKELNDLFLNLDKLEEDYYAIEDKKKKLESENKVLKYHLNDLMKKQKNNQKKIIESQNQIDFLNNKSKEKDQEIKILTNRLNTLRRMVAFGTMENPNENKINEYIQKVSNEKEDLKLKKKKKIKKINKDDNDPFFITENQNLKEEGNDNNENNNDNSNDKAELKQQSVDNYTIKNKNSDNNINENINVNLNNNLDED